MSKVDAESAKLALMELAEAFGVTEGAVAELLPIAMDGRLFLRDDKAVYVLAKPVKLHASTLEEVTLREPTGKDFALYSDGASVDVSRDGTAKVGIAMAATRTMSAVAKLSGESIAIVEQISRRDIRQLEEVCDALGFFD